ncbi:LysR family transcriptional regulator [Klebsiella pneumoniae]|uniref:LysR family transcriptional regulator n=1 Tax=Klebsiella pneumoniae TaxID=573 RepID=A0A377XSL5_KLEPN|nr:LysR family transcriptional regulator [Klebsiella pneumoniae]
MANAVIVTPVRWWTPGWRWEDDLRIADDRPVGVLRVRAPHAFGQQQLLAPLVAFLQRHPQLSVEWMLNDNTVDFLSDNIDCAIRVGAEVDPATVSVLLAEVPRCVVASPELLAKYPPLTSLEALSACHGSPLIPFISMRYGSGIRQAGRLSLQRLLPV